MRIDTILVDLKAERARLDRAITALEGVSRQVRRASSSPRSTRKKPDQAKISAATRLRMSKARKAWWAKQKAQASGKR